MSCFCLYCKAGREKVKVKSLSHVRLCDPMDCSLSGSSVRGIFQARVLEGITIPSPGDLPNPGIKPRSPALRADALPSEPPGKKEEGCKWLLRSQVILSAMLCCAGLCLVAQSCPTLCDLGLQPARLLCAWGFSRQEYLSGLPFPSPEDLPNPEIKPGSPALQADSLSLTQILSL